MAIEAKGIKRQDKKDSGQKNKIKNPEHYIRDLNFY